MAAAILGVWIGNGNSMRSVLLLSVLALASASGFLELVPKGTSAGSACTPTVNGYTTDTFILNPWPPARNEDVSFNMTGSFSQAETLNALVINVNYDKVPFDQVVLPRSGSYAKGASYKDGYTAFFPTIAPSGNYMVQLELRNTQNQYVSCWSVSFTL